ncbi:MAG TPA: transglutaminase family protein [Telmatospirillum sp.]|nr:transglutaminase family protein [Telmatospirillum sp.]
MIDPTNVLRPTDVIDFTEPSVHRLALNLASKANDPADIAARCFHWVRDEVAHICDVHGGTVVWHASDVLRERVGICYAKCHLLVALLRANAIPAGFSYQRLTFADAASGFGLHGLVALSLPHIGWYRVDPRGNKDGIDARFCPPTECLAYRVEQPGECDLAGVWPDPEPRVMTALTTARNWRDLLAHLPDIGPHDRKERKNCLTE